jgi:hypothetical protein
MGSRVCVCVCVCVCARAREKGHYEQAYDVLVADAQHEIPWSEPAFLSRATGTQRLDEHATVRTLCKQHPVPCGGWMGGWTGGGWVSEGDGWTGGVGRWLWWLWWLWWWLWWCTCVRVCVCVCVCVGGGGGGGIIQGVP